jgi:hypothetical protein
MTEFMVSGRLYTVGDGDSLFMLTDQSHVVQSFYQQHQYQHIQLIEHATSAATNTTTSTTSSTSKIPTSV